MAGKMCQKQIQREGFRLSPDSSGYPTAGREGWRAEGSVMVLQAYAGARSMSG